MSERVLVVDDEADILKLVAFNLQSAGFQTLTALTGQRAIEVATEALPDLIVLDLMLPDIQGTEVCRELKQSEATRNIPIIFLTAKGDEIDRVVGFELGADDYVTKPFSVRELVLRVRAVLKRHAVAPKEPRPILQESNVLTFGPIQLNELKHRVWVTSEEVHLTAREFKLLTTFLKNTGCVQSREQLLAEVWGVDVAVTTRTVDTHVKRLREKLGDAGQYIETVRGVGYRFAERPDA